MEVAEGMISETKAVDDARGLMVQAADLDTTFVKANFEAGHLHLLTIGKDLAVKYFMRVLRQDPDYNFALLFWIGKSYQFGLEFDKAIEYYNLYKDKLSKKPNYQGKDRVDLPLVDRAIFECQNGKEYVSNPGNFSIVNIGREINSEYEDYAPVLNEDENEIVFTTRRRDDNLNQNVDVDNKPF
ncbi:MAG: tetratricopeptide repeat protein [Bacteroidota bacterium]